MRKNEIKPPFENPANPEGVRVSVISVSIAYIEQALGL